MSDKKVVIAVAWPYVNGDIHIGHLAGYLLPADICARYHRLIGDETIMVSGSDCFGTPITVEADKRGVSPKEIVDEYHNKNVTLFEDILGLSFDLYTKTDNPTHIKTAQAVFLEFVKKDLLVRKTSRQFYSETRDVFLPDRYVVGTCPYCGFVDSRSDQCDNCTKLIENEDLIKPRHSLHDEPVILKETEHYFINWPKLQPFLEEYVERVSPTWKKWVRQETKGWLKEGLQERPITRDINWGIPIPSEEIPEEQKLENADKKRFYVWFEAVIGYLSATIEWAEINDKDWKSYWYGEDVEHYYFMGKDNLVFHTLFWPGQLHTYDEDLHLPDLPSINMYLNFEHKPFSTSRGHTIDSKKFVEEFGNNIVRFYLTYIMPEKGDSNFAWDEFEDRVNGVLVGNLGNFIHRTLSIGYGLDSESLKSIACEEEVLNEINNAFTNARSELQQCSYKKYLEVVLNLSAYGNKFVDSHKVWTLKKEDPQAFVHAMKQLNSIVLALGLLITPLLPKASDQLFEMLHLPTVERWPDNKEELESFLEQVNSIKMEDKPTPLFKKIEETDYLEKEF